MEVAASVRVSQSDEAEDPSAWLNRTSLTMSAGDLNTIGGSGVKEDLVSDCLLFGGL